MNGSLKAGKFAGAQSYEGGLAFFPQSGADQAAYDTDLVVYDGCDCGALNLLGCNDDGPGCGGFTSELTVPVTAGNCYLVRVGGWMDGDQGDGTVDLSTKCGPDCVADFNGDGVVGVPDLLTLLGFWNMPGGDLNGDGTTSVPDLLILLSSWGPC